MNRVVVITGASRGIGAATARLAAERGWDVAVNYLRDQGAAEAVAEHVRAAGRRAVVVQADTAVEADVVRLFETAGQGLGRASALVNNAGIVGHGGPVAEMTAADIARVMAVNVTGCFLAAREAVRRMSTKRGGAGGVIVNVSSIASRLGSPGEFVHYAASKGAIDTFTIGLAREVAGEGIRVNAVRPGMIDTDIQHVPGLGDRLARIIPTVPMRRIGTAEEVARAIVWLMSDEASYVTGAHLEIGGGR
jgi:NAD(P)-dependent dehydrogenase (short-subunit alcohol dehydrogenase family)